MEKPKGFFHKSRVGTGRMHDYPYQRHEIYKTYYHMGRFQISAEAVGVLILVYVAAMAVLQLFLALFSGGTVWWPAWSLLGLLAFYFTILILRFVVWFFSYIAGEIKINGPEVR